MDTLGRKIAQQLRFLVHDMLPNPEHGTLHSADYGNSVIMEVIRKFLS